MHTRYGLSRRLIPTLLLGVSTLQTLPAGSSDQPTEWTANLYLVNVQDPDFPVEKITEGEVHLGRAFSGGMDWSRDGERIVFAHTPLSRADSWLRADISVVDLATREVNTLVATGASEGSPVFSPDGEYGD